MNQHKNNSIANDKPHGLIPFYIPHAGCPQQCVFCNQHRIAAGGARASEVDVKATIDEYIGNERHEKYWEVASMAVVFRVAGRLTTLFVGTGL